MRSIFFGFIKFLVNGCLALVYSDKRTMAVEEGWSFTLPERPESACYSPSTNSLVVCGKEGKISCYDLISGQQLCEAGKSCVSRVFLIMHTMTFFRISHSEGDMYV